MSKQDIEIVIVGSGGHSKSVMAAIEGGLLERFSGAVRFTYQPSPIYSEPKIIARGLSIQSLKVAIDNDELALRSGAVDISKLEAALATPGEALGLPAIDPLESAINSTLSAIRDERESGKGLSINDHDNREGVLSILGGHLVRLLELRVTQLSAQTVITCSQVGDITHTEITSGRH